MYSHPLTKLVPLFCCNTAVMSGPPNTFLNISVCHLSLPDQALPLVPPSGHKSYLSSRVCNMYAVMRCGETALCPAKGSAPIQENRVVGEKTVLERPFPFPSPNRSNEGLSSQLCSSDVESALIHLKPGACSCCDDADDKNNMG